MSTTSYPTVKPYRLTAATVGACMTMLVAAHAAPSQDKIKLYSSAVAEQTRDPASAKFDNLRIISEPENREGLCGRMNAKNGFGGYTGMQWFYANIITGKGRDGKLAAIAVINTTDILHKCGID